MDSKTVVTGLFAALGIIALGVLGFRLLRDGLSNIEGFLGWLGMDWHNEKGGPESK